VNLEPSIEIDEPIEAYHADFTSYSKSSLTSFSVSPLQLQHDRQHPKESTAFDLGKAAHMRLLEPKIYEHMVKVSDLHRNSKDFKRLKAQYPQATFIKPDQEADVIRMVKAVRRHPAAGPLFQGGQAEVSARFPVFFERYAPDGFARCYRRHWEAMPVKERHQLILKTRPDYLHPDGRIVDLKTTSDISPAGLQRITVNAHYLWSAFLSLWGLTEATGNEYDRYFFVFVQVSPPHDVVVKKVGLELVAMAEVEVTEILNRLALCDYQNHWPGQSDQVTPLEVPRWYHARFNQAIIE
jgi:hypothetical protein